MSCRSRTSGSAIAMSLDGVAASHAAGHGEEALSGDAATSARPSSAAGPVVRASNGRVVVALAGELGAVTTRMLVERLRAMPPSGPIVIVVDGVTLRRHELRVLNALVADLSGLDVYLSCSRLSGRRLLTHLLPTRPLVVAYPQDATPGMTRRAGVRGTGSSGSRPAPPRPPPTSSASPPGVPASSDAAAWA